MPDLKNPQLIWIKGILFLLLGLLASALLLLQAPDVVVALLLVVSIWAFCRFYYFVFYVIQHYVDSRYRFAGLISFLRYVWTARGKQKRNRRIGGTVRRFGNGRDQKSYHTPNPTISSKLR